MPVDQGYLWDALVRELEPAKEEKVSSRTLADVCTRVLRGVMNDGSVAPGEKLPGEHELAEMLRVSRATVREALRTLERERRITRRRGIGTVVLPEVIRKDLSLNFGITAMIENAGLQDKLEEIELTAEKADGRVAEALQLDKGAEALKVSRVRVVDGRPIVWSVDWVPGQLIGRSTLERFTKGEFSTSSLYDFLKEAADHAVVCGFAELRAVLATGIVAQKLRVRRGAAIMEMKQVDIDRKHLPVLYSAEYHLPDAVEFHIQRLGPFS